MKKRLLSLVMACVMLLLAVPLSLFPVYAADTDGVVASTTVFSPESENWPTFDPYDASTMAKNSYVGVTYNGSWQIGSRSRSGEVTAFTPYTRLIKATDAGAMVLSCDTSFWSQWGGVYMTGDPYAFFSAGSYTSDYKTATIVADPTVRYTVEKTGTVEIDLGRLSFYTDMGAGLTVYHNGKAVSTPLMAEGGKRQIKNGALVAATAADISDKFKAVQLNVKVGDTIDFVSHANEQFCGSNTSLGINNFDRSVYTYARYGFFDLEFKISYIEKNAPAATRFSTADKTGFPVFESYNPSLMKLGDYVDATYTGPWQIGYRKTAGEKANFTPYNRLYKASNSGQMILSYDGAYWTERGGMYVTGEPSLMFSGMSYATDYKSVTAHVADPTVRYTAEYTGTAVIKLNELLFYADNAAYLDILHNGEPLISSYKANSSYYRVREGAAAKLTAANVGADLGVLVVELKEGDTLDFVSRANDDFNGSHLEELGLAKFDSTEYSTCAKRGVYGLDIEISFRVNKSGGKTEDYRDPAVTLPTSSPLPLFVWYTESGERVASGSARPDGSIPSVGATDMIFSSIAGLTDWFGLACGYAAINPDLIGTVIDAGASYAEVLAAYKAYLTTFLDGNATAFTGPFAAGVRANGALAHFCTLSTVNGRNLFAVKQQTPSKLGAAADYSFATDFLASYADAALAIDAFFANAAAILPSGNVASELRIKASDLQDGMTYAAATSAGALYKNGKLYLSPVEGSVAAISYTVPSGLSFPILSFSAAVTADGADSPLRYAIAHNGQVIWPAGATASSFSASDDTAWAHAASASELQAALAALSFEVESGEAVELLIACDYENGKAVSAPRVHVALSAKTENYGNARTLEITSGDSVLYRGLHEFGSTVTLSSLGLPTAFGQNGVYINRATESVELPKTLFMSGDYHLADRALLTSASISISSAFALNLYVQADANATAAGVIMDGVKHEGANQGGGIFRLSFPILPKDMPTATFTYRAYQTVGGKDMANGIPVTVSVFDLLSLYEASEDNATAMLAGTVRHYSLAARDYFVNDRLTLSAGAQSALRESDADILSMVQAYRAGTAYQPYPSGVNANSFPYRIKGATLMLENRLAFAFRVDRTSGAAFGNPALYLRVTDENGTVRYTAAAGGSYNGNLEMLYYVKNLPATEFGTEFSFTLVDANGVAQSATLTYSAHAYIARTFDTANGDSTTFHYLARGIYALGKASAAYASAHNSYDKDYIFPVTGGGDSIAVSSPVLSALTYNEATATAISASAIPSATLVGGRVYRISEGAVTFSSGSSFNGRGAILLAPGGLIIDGASSFTLSNLSIVGPVIIRNAQNVTLENCSILHKGGAAVTVEASASFVTLNACRADGRDAVINAANNLTVYASYLGFERYGVRDAAAKGTLVQNCRLVGTGVGEAIRSAAADAILRNNTLTLEDDGARGIVIEGNAKTANLLIAQNIIRGTYESISVKGTTNTSVVLNSVVLIRAEGNKNLYICDNAVGGKLMLENNDYLLANGNTSPKDAADHAAYAKGNTNVNGDNLTDVNARVTWGTNEDLLPHLDKDLFLDMDRKTTVKEPLVSGGLTLYSYILREAARGEVVIVAPGAYAVEEVAAFTAAHSGTTVYAYGVLAEGVRYANANYTKAHVTATDVNGLAIKGLSIGYAQPSGGQVYVLEKLGSNKIRVATAAGFFNDFSISNPSILRKATDFALYRAGNDYPIGEAHLSSIVKNADGTMTITMPAADYEIIKKGDVMTCRLANYVHVVHTKRCSNVLLEDFTQYGYAGGYAFYEEYNETGVVYHRVTDTNKAGMVIDKATYDKYAAWESTYGVDLEISTDAQGRYRGPAAKVSSLDGVHTSFGGNGPQIISSVIEKMTDDGSNINAYHSRLGGWVDNGDGTVTLIYKGNLTGRIYGLGSTNGAYDNRNCAPFRVGDRILIYTAAGQLVCDTPVLATVCGAGLSYYDKVNSTYTSSVFGGLPITRYAVKVAKSAVNTAALSGYNLSDDSEDDTKKVLVENVSRSSAGALYDNSVFRCGLGSAMRLKASGSVIKNCTIDKIAKPGICMTMDVWWGESGVASDILIKDNVIGRTGYSIYGIRPIEATDTNYKSVPITIMGLGGSSMDEDYLIFRDIVIEGNRFTDRCLDNYNAAIYARAVKNLTVRNNDFGSLAGETASKYCGVLYLNGVANVELSGNTYSPYVSGNYSLYVQGRPYKNIYGTDVVIGGVSKIPNKS